MKFVINLDGSPEIYTGDTEKPETCDFFEGVPLERSAEIIWNTLMGDGDERGWCWRFGTEAGDDFQVREEEG